MSLMEELSCDGVKPSGPVSAWPQERHEKLIEQTQAESKTRHATKVKAGFSKMTQGLMKSGVQALAKGKVSSEVRDERYETCKSCPSFIEASKRCADCGCFMEAKTWIGGDPNTLCPLAKWSR